MNKAKEKCVEILKEISQEEIIIFTPLKPKRKCNAPKIDFEKKKIKDCIR